MNKNVFKNPVELMENILGVTSYLREKIIKKGGNPDRETLNVIPALDGKPYYQDSFGDYWRSYIFITDASSYDQVENPDQFYQAAMAFGNFQNLLADYPADTLFETIEGFHDTKARFEVFKRAVETDIKSRAAGVKKEIQFVLDHEDVACCFLDVTGESRILFSSSAMRSLDMMEMRAIQCHSVISLAFGISLCHCKYIYNNNLRFLILKSIFEQIIRLPYKLFRTSTDIT